MNNSNRSVQQLILAIGIGIVIGCCLGALVLGGLAAQPLVVAALFTTPTVPPPPTSAARPTITLAPPPTRVPTTTPIVPQTVAPLVAMTATATRPPLVTRTPRPITEHFMVGRPVMPNAASIIPALTYLYGTTARGTLDVHHGEEFVNPTGTTLIAAADGTVVTAGNDAKRICGDDGKKTCGRDVNFYGNLVVIRLDQLFNGQPVFVLNGHMNSIGVNVGDHLQAGDPIGEVGMTGIALGPHVHFEIRLGVNDYAHTRDPILWMTPLQGRGSIAGRFAEKGALVRGALVNLYRGDDTFYYSTETYSRDDAPPVNSDEDLDENFAFPDLQPGEYIVRIANQAYASRVTVTSGKLAFVEIGGQ